MDTNLSANLHIMTNACQRIARFMLRDFGEIEQLQSSINGSSGFANASKVKIEKTLIDNLLEARPKYGVLTPSSEIKGSDISHRFIVNVIDGFENYSHGFPFFSISVALQEQKKLIASVIYNPVLDKMFYAENGGGAFLSETRMTRRIRVSPKKDYEQSLIIYSGKNAEDLKLKTTLPLQTLNTDGLNLGYLSAGMIDAYIGKGKNVFDLSAGVLIAKEAGAIVRAYDKDGKITDKLFEADLVICGNNYLQSELTSIIIK
ncbi:MAG: inositol monophosphatase family protein [Alphaproteobacteria bacterium]